MNNRGFTLVELVIGLLIVAIVAMIIAIPIFQNTNARNVQFEVNRVTEITRSTGDGGATSQYLVFTEDGKVYQNEDALFYGKWNSSNLQAQMKEGDCWQAKVVGYRVPVLSWYPNIIRLYECK